jgi:hypothetical protein
VDWFRWLFVQQPPLWVWIFSFMGMVALLMTIQPFAPFFWGRPKINIIFDINRTRKQYNIDIKIQKGV